jgi:hypothetical protein
MTNAGEDGFPGNAEPNRRTETATLIDLHDSSRADVEARDMRATPWNLTKMARLRIRDGRWAGAATPDYGWRRRALAGGTAGVY